MLERDAELRALEVALEPAGSGLGTPVLLEGPAGIGKSRLLGTTTLQLAGELGLPCLRARAELEQELAFGVGRQLFASALLELDAGERERLITNLGAGAEALLTASGPPAVRVAVTGPHRSMRTGWYTTSSTGPTTAWRRAGR